MTDPDEANTIEGLARLVHEVDTPPEDLKDKVQKRLDEAQLADREKSEKDKGKGK